MYNPANLNECEKEKMVERRKVADRIMIFVGLVAALSSLPQVIKILETGDVSGISLTTYILSTGAVIAWLLYGIYIKNRPLIYTTVLTTIINSAVILQILLGGSY